MTAGGRSDRPAISPAVFAKVASGVALIRTYDCSGRPVAEGTGFLVGKQLVMTARHVVAGACRVRALLGNRSYTTSLIKSWYSNGSTVGQTDLATMRLDRPAPGYVFYFSSGIPPLGATVAMIGHPLGNPISLAQGPLIKKVVIKGTPTLVVWLATAEGASGSPLLNRWGDVVGILQQGFVKIDAGAIFGINLARWWGKRAEKDLCRVYRFAGVPGCGTTQPPSPPPPPPPPPPTPPFVAGQYCGTNSQSKAFCFQVSSDGSAVISLWFSSTATCTDGSTWNWTLGGAANTPISSGTGAFSINYSSSVIAPSGISNLAASYTFAGSLTTYGSGSGSAQLSHISWDENGTHYDCSGSITGWNALRQAVIVDSAWLSTTQAGSPATTFSLSGGPVYVNLTFEAFSGDHLLHTEWITPSGQIWASGDHPIPAGSPSSSVYANIQSSGLTGVWHLNYTIDGVLRGQLFFTVTP